MLRNILNLSLVFSAVMGFTYAQNSTLLRQVMKSSDPAIQRIVQNSKKYELQIVLTQILKNETNKVQFERSTYQLDESFYFYPASTVKLPIAVLALQKLRALQKAGIDIDAETPFKIFDANGNLVIGHDPTHPEGKLTIAHLIKKIFLVSDNTASNYLFDFLGVSYIHRELYNKGLKQIQITHKFLAGDLNEKSGAYTFFGPDGVVRYQQPPIKDTPIKKKRNLKGIKKGIGFFQKGEYIALPFDFTAKNRASLLDLEGVLKRVVFPELFTDKEQFELETLDYEFLNHWMSRHTLESRAPDYNTLDYWDSYGKFFIYGDQKGQMNDQLRITNKVGYAYGTLTDIAYIDDKEYGLSFFLSATLLVNENEIFNDDTYEYDSLGIPFLAALGRQVLAHLRNSQPIQSSNKPRATKR